MRLADGLTIEGRLTAGGIDLWQKLNARLQAPQPLVQAPLRRHVVVLRMAGRCVTLTLGYTP